MPPYQQIECRPVARLDPDDQVAFVVDVGVLRQGNRQHTFHDQAALPARANLAMTISWSRRPQARVEVVQAGSAPYTGATQGCWAVPPNVRPPRRVNPLKSK